MLRLVTLWTGFGDSAVVEHQACDRKVDDPWFDSQTGNALLCPWERHFMLISHWDQAVYPLSWLWWPSLTKDLQTEAKIRCSTLAVGVVRLMQSAWFIQTNGMNC